MVCAVLCVLQVVHAIGYGAFVVMGKLNDEVVTCTHLRFDGSPIGCAGIESARVSARFTPVIDGHKSGVKERTKVHTPTAFIGCVLVVLGHRGVTDRVHFDGTVHGEEAHGSYHQKGKEFFHNSEKK